MEQIQLLREAQETSSSSTKPVHINVNNYRLTPAISYAPLSPKGTSLVPQKIITANAEIQAELAQCRVDYEKAKSEIKLMRTLNAQLQHQNAEWRSAAEGETRKMMKRLAIEISGRLESSEDDGESEDDDDDDDDDDDEEAVDVDPKRRVALAQKAPRCGAGKTMAMSPSVAGKSVPMPITRMQKTPDQIASDAISEALLERKAMANPLARSFEYAERQPGEVSVFLPEDEVLAQGSVLPNYAETVEFEKNFEPTTADLSEIFQLALNPEGDIIIVSKSVGSVLPTRSTSALAKSRKMQALKNVFGSDPDDDVADKSDAVDPFPTVLHATVEECGDDDDDDFTVSKKSIVGAALAVQTNKKSASSSPPLKKKKRQLSKMSTTPKKKACIAKRIHCQYVGTEWKSARTEELCTKLDDSGINFWDYCPMNKSTIIVTDEMDGGGPQFMQAFQSEDLITAIRAGAVIVSISCFEDTIRELANAGAISTDVQTPSTTDIRAAMMNSLQGFRWRYSKKHSVMFSEYTRNGEKGWVVSKEAKRLGVQRIIDCLSWHNSETLMGPSNCGELAGTGNGVSATLGFNSVATLQLALSLCFRPLHDEN